MKKIIAFTLASWVIFTSQAFAYEDIKTTVIATPTVQELQKDSLAEKYEVIIRNNKIVSDYEYNNIHYYTKKITTKDIVIPEEIQKNASKIYFLIEEWHSMVYAKAEMFAMDSVETDSVTKEYNYKIVPFVSGKEEYTFNTSDLVKDFEKDEYKNVVISLVAETKDGEKTYLANAAYLNIWTKASTLESLKNLQDEWNTTYFGYYNTESLETYLEKLSENLSRADYKKMLTNSQSRLKSLISKNTAAQKEIITSIQKESDFEKNVEKYSLSTETNNLLNNVLSATQQQLQKIRAFELIDSVFGK